MKSPALEVKLSNALLNLLTQTSYQQISVKKICQKAQVNRTSFYLCFNNLDDCLKFTFNLFLEPFYSSLKQAFVVKAKIGHDKAIHYFQQILQPLKQVQQILESNDHEVQDKFLQLIREISFKCLQQALKDKSFQELNCQFYVRAYTANLIQLLHFWLDHPALDADYIATLCYKYLFTGLNSILE